MVVREATEDGGARSGVVESACQSLGLTVDALEACLGKEEAERVLEVDAATFHKLPQWNQRALRRKALLYLPFSA